MIGAAFHAVIYLPIYNALVYFVDVVPTHDIGIAVIIVTIIVRIILFPLAKRAIKSQVAMKAVAPEIEELKKKYKDKPEEQGRAMFALYRERKVNPFSGFLLLLLLGLRTGRIPCGEAGNALFVCRDTTDGQYALPRAYRHGKS
jgi:membrane protein insertase Oxa1/YidC/SpoIIIJ